MRVNHGPVGKEDLVASSSPGTLNARRLDFKEDGVVLVTSDAVTASSRKSARGRRESVCRLGAEGAVGGLPGTRIAGRLALGGRIWTIIS